MDVCLLWPSLAWRRAVDSPIAPSTYPQHQSQTTISSSTPPQLAVIDCLEDPDETLKRKTLDLLHRMTNSVNVETITAKVGGGGTDGREGLGLGREGGTDERKNLLVCSTLSAAFHVSPRKASQWARVVLPPSFPSSKTYNPPPPPPPQLLEFLEKSNDAFLRADLVQRVASSAERFAPSTAWYIQTMTRVRACIPCPALPRMRAVRLASSRSHSPPLSLSPSLPLTLSSPSPSPGVSPRRRPGQARGRPHAHAARGGGDGRCVWVRFGSVMAYNFQYTRTHTN